MPSPSSTHWPVERYHLMSDLWSTNSAYFKYVFVACVLIFIQNMALVILWRWEQECVVPITSCIVIRKGCILIVIQRKEVHYKRIHRAELTVFVANSSTILCFSCIIGIVQVDVDHYSNVLREPKVLKFYTEKVWELHTHCIRTS